MYFNLKRFYYGMLKRKMLLLLLIVIPVLYLLTAAVLPDKYQVKQKIYILDETPVASSINPVNFKVFRELRDSPEEFFLNPFDLKNSMRRVIAVYGQQYDSMSLQAIVRNCRFIVSGTSTVQVVYEGKHLQPGKLIVAYFSSRLAEKAQEGLMRSNAGKDAPVAKLLGGLEVASIKVLWSQDRFLPLVLSCLISIIIIFALLCFIEWTDPSFKSERQIARYTDLPVIGSIPDLNVVSEVLNENKPEPEAKLQNQFNLIT